MNKRKCFMLVVVLVVCMATFVVKGYCDRSMRTPEYALEQAGLALQQQDAERFARYVALDVFVLSAYDDGAEQLAQQVTTLHARYPKDYFFWHDAAFMKSYAAAHREAALPFLHSVLDHYFQKETVADSFETNPTVWLAGEIRKFQANGTAEIQSVHIEGDKAFATVAVRGNATVYGKLLDGISLSLELCRQSDGHWQVQRIANAEELTLPITDRAETFWTMQGWQ